jgi:hypothetical protein
VHKRMLQVIGSEAHMPRLEQATIFTHDIKRDVRNVHACIPSVALENALFRLGCLLSLFAVAQQQLLFGPSSCWHGKKKLVHSLLLILIFS